MAARRSIIKRARWKSAAALGLGLIGLVAAVAIIPFGCQQQHGRFSSSPQGTPIVRVLLLDNRTHVNLAAQEPPTLRAPGASGARLNLSGGSSVDVRRDGAGWRIGELAISNGEIVIEPASEGSVSIEGRAYRGRYRLVPRAGDKFDVVNDVDVDAYLMGVLSKELFPAWHEEAYRAQAIVARTYAIYCARTSPAGAGFDLFTDTRSQVYGGIGVETAKSRQAVDATRGVVVAYGPPGEEKIFKAYFSSCCGGITQSADAAFGDPPLEALGEQNIGPRCSAAPRFSWPTVTVSKAELTRRFRIWGAANNAPLRSVGTVSHIDIYSTNHFGRPTSFAVTDTAGLRYRIGCEDLRVAVNTDATDGARLNSSFCQPVNEAASVHFTNGHGFGHGVGLCQWCAQTQALSGTSYQQIVLSAFPRSVLVKAY